MKRSVLSGRGAGLTGSLLALAAVLLGSMVMGDRAAAQEPGQVLVSPRAAGLSVLGGQGGYLGVAINEVDEERARAAGLREEHGAYVSSVQEGGPAAKAGLREGDIIVGWNGTRVESVAQLQRLTRETPPGRTVRLDLWRDGARRDVSVALGDRAEAGRLRVFTVPGGDRLELRRDVDRPRLLRPGGEGPGAFVFSRRPRLGVSTQMLGEQLAAYFGVEGGALITSVREGSPAAAAGLRAGDVIIAIAGDDVDDPGDLLRALADVEPGPVEVRVVRDRGQRSFTVELPEAGPSGEGPGVGVFRYFGEGEDALHIEPFTMEGFRLGPLEFDGLELTPFEWHHEWDGETLDISIPSIEIPAFELPGLDLEGVEIPGLEVRTGRVVIDV